MLANLLKALPLAFLSQSLVIVGLYMISGQLLPAQFAGFYARAGIGLRTAIVSVTVFPLANFLAGYAFAHFTPAVVSPTLIAMTVLTQILFTVWVTEARPGLMIVPVTLLVMAGCVWVSFLLAPK